MPLGKQRFSLEEVEAAMGDYIGFCTACGAERECYEPDARDYPCDDCGKRAVFGAEECIIMGIVDDH